MGRCPWRLARLWPLLLLAASCGGEATSPQEVWAAYARIVTVEDARGDRPTDLLFEAARHGSPRVRAWALRGMGRLGQPALADSIAPGLRDPDAEVRVAAAHALATAAMAGGEPLPPGRRLAPLERALEGEGEAGEGAEEDAWVRGELGYALVRASRGPSELAAAGRVLDRIVTEPGLQGADSTAVAARLAVARAYHRLGRLAPPEWWTDSSITSLRLLARTGSADDSLNAVRVRRLAVGTLRSEGALGVGGVVAAMGDTDGGVRRQGVLALVPDGPVPDWEQRLEGALTDPDATVRFEALRVFGRWARPIVGCGAILQAVDDASAHVVLEALDLLAEPCPGRAFQVERLMGEVLPGLAALHPDAPAGSGTGADWHRAAHALAALASLDPELARPHL
ncbi:MAG TPA: HEAT repeat domain-containing protein, partial [Longimicrobiales bacterium]|nr:HEAT repeat domain-containing protein [Longimicrobiales bacterium]